MSFRNTIIVLVLALGLGGYAYYSAYYTKPPEAQKILNIPQSDIASIDLKYPDREILIERPKVGEWRLVKPIGVDADQTTANNLARAIADAVLTRTVDENPPVFDPLRLAKPRRSLPSRPIRARRSRNRGRQDYSDRIQRLRQNHRQASGNVDRIGVPGRHEQDRRSASRTRTDALQGRRRHQTHHREGQRTDHRIVRDGDRVASRQAGCYLADSTQVRQLLSTLVNSKVVDFVSDAPGALRNTDWRSRTLP